MSHSRSVRDVDPVEVGFSGVALAATLVLLAAFLAPDKVSNSLWLLLPFGFGVLTGAAAKYFLQS